MIPSTGDKTHLGRNHTNHCVTNGLTLQARTAIISICAYWQSFSFIPSFCSIHSLIFFPLSHSFLTSVSLAHLNPQFTRRVKPVVWSNHKFTYSLQADSSPAFIHKPPLHVAGLHVSRELTEAPSKYRSSHHLAPSFIPTANRATAFPYIETTFRHKWRNAPQTARHNNYETAVFRLSSKTQRDQLFANCKVESYYWWIYLFIYLNFIYRRKRRMRGLLMKDQQSPSSQTSFFTEIPRSCYVTTTLLTWIKPRREIRWQGLVVTLGHKAAPVFGTGCAY